MDALLVFVIGMVIGSFLNVCIYRVPKRISLVKPRSFCPHCGIPISARYNIPVLSYIILRGRCAQCAAKIPVRYPLVEALAGVLTLITYYRFGLAGSFIFYTVFIYFLIVIAFIDLHTTLIYNKILILLLAFGLVGNILTHTVDWISATTGFLAGGLSLFLLALLGNKMFGRESMGMGDIKLAAVAGFFIGFKWILLALYIGFVLALLAVALIKLKKNMPTNKLIPMGPFFAVAFVIFLFWGDLLVNLYWSLII